MSLLGLARSTPVPINQFRGQTESWVVIWVKPTSRRVFLNYDWSLDQPIKEALNIEPIRELLQPRGSPGVYKQKEGRPGLE